MADSTTCSPVVPCLDALTTPSSHSAQSSDESSVTFAVLYIINSLGVTQHQCFSANIKFLDQLKAGLPDPGKSLALLRDCAITCARPLQHATSPPPIHPSAHRQTDNSSHDHAEPSSSVHAK
ncbi:hypothetical protein ECG_09207 [Echinococcus granulosus]|nr:hypothetical protein ECG_09207 [Echinococcus granulosus]